MSDTKAAKGQPAKPSHTSKLPPPALPLQVFGAEGRADARIVDAQGNEIAHFHQKQDALRFSRAVMSAPETAAERDRLRDALVVAERHIEDDQTNGVDFEACVDALSTIRAALAGTAPSEAERLRLVNAELVAALERIATHEARSDRRARGMVDISELTDMQRIARAAIAKT